LRPQIRLGIEATPEIVVLRAQIAQLLVNDNRLAATFNYQDAQQAVSGLRVFLPLA
jgi:sRNA-binding carbon storage regulator CsrA